MRGKLSADGRVTLRNPSPVWVAQQYALVQAHRAAVYQAAAYHQAAQQHYAAQQYAAQQYGVQPQYPGQQDILAASPRPQ